MDQHLAALWVSQQGHFYLVFPTDSLQETKIEEEIVKKSVKNFFANSSEPDMQTFAMEFDAGADIVSTPFPGLCQISIKFVWMT